MKRVILSVLGLLALSAAARPFTYETPTALTSVGDLDNDGRPDVVLVDRATGVIRYALQQADGTFRWAAPAPSGLPTPTALSVGRFGGSALGDQIAVTQPDANRATLFSLPATNVALSARHATPAQPMPHGITALDYGENGMDDLVFFGEKSRASACYERLVTQLAGVPLVYNAGRESTDRTHHGFPFVRKAGTTPVAVVTRGTRVRMAPASTLGFDDGIILSEVIGTPDMLMAWGNFDGSDYPHVVLYRPGETNLVAALVEEFEGDFDWCAPAEYGFAKSIQLVVTIPLASGARLAILFTDGTAAVFDFDGSGAPTARSTLPGGPFDWLLPLGADALLTGRGDVVERWDTSPDGGAVLSPAWSASLPAMHAASRFSNVVFVNAEPFVQPTAMPVGTGHAFDWSLSADLDFPNWWVSGLNQTPDGLETAAEPTGLASPTSAAYALVNQYRPNVSIRLLESSVGPPLDDIAFSPRPGAYQPPEFGGFEVTLTPSMSVAHVFWRTSAEDTWTNGTTVELFGDVTIEAFSVRSRGSYVTLSPVRRATYTFAPSPELATGESPDLDEDGLPDEWENVFNVTDPLADTDRDGKNNLQEFQDKTDPRDAGGAGFPAPFQLAATKMGPTENAVFVLEWPLAHADAILRRCEDLQGGEWIPVTDGIEQTATGFRYAVPADAPAAFFQLWKP